MSLANASLNILGNELWDTQDKIDKEKLQEQFESHDCKRSKDSGCLACQEYYKLINK